MNQKSLAIIITIATALILLWQTNLVSDLLLFVLMGVIPGTEHSLSPTTMLALIIGCVLLLGLSTTPLRLLGTKLLTYARTVRSLFRQLHDHTTHRA